MAAQEPQPNEPYATLEQYLDVVHDIYHNGSLANPLRDHRNSINQLRAFGREFARQMCVRDNHPAPDRSLESLFEVAAVLAGGYEPQGDWVPDLLRDNSNDLWNESRQNHGRVTGFRNAWARLSSDMKLVIYTCGFAAATQGWNETAVNGANIFFKRAFGIEDNKLLYGFINAAPYAACAVFTYPIISAFDYFKIGRVATIQIACGISFVSCFLQGFSRSWTAMLIFRLILGTGMGPKSATVPIYVAESVPAPMRGMIVMLWQVCVAAGIFFGNVSGIAFYNIEGAKKNSDCLAPDASTATLLSKECSLNWRLMVGSPIILPLIAIWLLCYCPESPRFHIKNGHSLKAFTSLKRLRRTHLEAARDLFYTYATIHIEQRIEDDPANAFFLVIFTNRRTRRAMLASGILMFLQQMCGINILIYYSAEVIQKASGKEIVALGTSCIVGALNVICAYPAFRAIDQKGRRWLLLLTFPLMAVSMLWIALSLTAQGGARTPLLLCGMFLFTIVYSFGEGPVPFTYSGEAHSSSYRAKAMALSVSITWVFNFILSLSWPKMESSWGSKLSFIWYMFWNIVGFLMIFFWVPETKRRTLEELDQVFFASSREFQRVVWRRAMFYFKLRKDKPSHAYDIGRQHQISDDESGHDDIFGEPIPMEVAGVGFDDGDSIHNQ